MKIATIVGARPQFIKAAVISRAIYQSNKTVTPAYGDGKAGEKIVAILGQPGF